jgi:hypothetical protein
LLNVPLRPLLRKGFIVRVGKREILPGRSWQNA